MPDETHDPRERDAAHAEDVRARAEERREFAEERREAQSAQSGAAETDRAKAESGRAAAEAGRVDTESLRKAAEIARSAAESTRAEREAIRVLQERVRRDAEAVRLLAEQARQSAEEARDAVAEQRSISQEMEATRQRIQAAVDSMRKAASPETRGGDITEHRPETHDTGNAVILYESCLASSRQAIDAGLLEVGFHSLSAALHCAERLEDLARVKAIEDLADRTQQRLDSEHPDHRIGSRAAADRGHTPLFKTLALHAQSSAARIRGVDAVAGANRVSGLESQRKGHTSDTPPKESGGSSTA